MHAFEHILQRIYKKSLANPGLRVMLMMMDVRVAFRQLPVDPKHAHQFCYVVGRVLVIKLRGCFGWKGTPAEFDLWPQAFQHKCAALT